MTKDEWKSVVEAAISESGIDATWNMGDCSPASNACFATVQEAETGRLIEVQADRQEGVAMMQESVIRQLRAEKSN